MKLLMTSLDFMYYTYECFKVRFFLQILDSSLYVLYDYTVGHFHWDKSYILWNEILWTEWLKYDF